MKARVMLKALAGPARRAGRFVWLAVPCAIWLGGSGCSTTPPIPTGFIQTNAAPYRDVRLREGDSVRVAYPGAPNLDSVQQVRRDGKITVTLGGECDALGKTPSELEKAILDQFGSQLQVKQVVVTLTTSAYPVFITGAVLRPGKISAERPLSALEAVMEAGGFDYAKANLKAVTVLRQEQGRVVNYKLNFREILKGPKSDPFYLKPSDILYVPEKFSWF